MLGHAVDQDFLGGGGGLVLGQEGVAQVVVLIGTLPGEEGEGAGEAVAGIVLGGGGATFGGAGAGGVLGVLLVGGDLGLGGHGWNPFLGESDFLLGESDFRGGKCKTPEAALAAVRRG